MMEGTEWVGRRERKPGVLCSDSLEGIRVSGMGGLESTIGGVFLPWPHG